MDPLDDLLESIEEASPDSDADEAASVIKRTAEGLASAWEDTAAQKARVRELKQLLAVFLKAGKTLRLYREGHGFFDGFVEEFITRLYRQFEVMDALTFEITPYSINWEGNIIFENPEQRENMAFKLHRDGVRLLQFRRGVNSTEVREFVGLIAREVDRGYGGGSDLSVLFWEADFKSIQIAVAETFVDYSEEAVRVLHNIQEELNNLRGAFQVQGSQDTQQAAYQPFALHGLDGTSQGLGQDEDGAHHSTDLDADTAMRLFQAGGDSGGTGETVAATPRKPYTPNLPLETFDDLAMQQVYDDLQGIDNPFATFEEVGVVIAAVIAEETDPKALERLLEHLDDAISPLLNSAALGPLNSILRRLSLICKTPSKRVPLRTGLLQGYFENLCKTQRLTLLARAINATWEDDWKGELFTFVSLQQPASFDELIGFLNQLHPDQPRRVVVDALLLLSEQEPKRFSHLTDDASPRLACDALFALSRLEDPLTINRICGTFERPEPMVREAVINSLRDYQSPRIHRLMLQGLADKDEDVRLAALRYVTIYKVRAAVDPISEAIRTRAFAKRTFDERRGWYIALGRIAGQGALAALRKQAEPARGQSDIDEQTHLALLGIRSIRTSKARTFLESFAEGCQGDLQLLTHKLLAERRGSSS